MAPLAEAKVRAAGDPGLPPWKKSTLATQRDNLPTESRQPVLFGVASGRSRVACTGQRMSALGQKQTLECVRAMSALPPKADIAIRKESSLKEAAQT